MKGQALNLDWVVATGLFISTVIFGLLMINNPDLGPSSTAQLRQKAELVQDQLDKQTVIKGRKAPLEIDTPVNVSKVPIDRSYIFPEEAVKDSGVMDIPSEINISNDSVITVVNGVNSSHFLSYFEVEKDDLTYSNSIETGSWMNNSMIQVKPASPGLEALEINDQEVLNSTADLNDNSFTVEEEELHASSLSETLKIYDGSKELILEEPGEVTFNLKNFTTLYWYKGNTTTDLVGTGTFNDSQTQGFTVASDYGITFIGDLDAKVSKPSKSYVKATINTDSRLRIFLHDSDYTAGWQRIKFHDEGDIYFGGEKVLEGASEGKINGLENANINGFENRLDLEEFDYNISYGSLDRGSEVPLQDVVVSERPGVKLERYGNYTRIDNRVILWR